jgi:hypothetical protein
MSGGKACACAEKLEPIHPLGRTTRPGRLWRVLDRHCNHSAFNGYHRTWSAYSALQCLRCGRVWRTKAAYVDLLKDRADSEENVSWGHASHAARMREWGREPHD